MGRDIQGQCKQTKKKIRHKYEARWMKGKKYQMQHRRTSYYKEREPQWELNSYKCRYANYQHSWKKFEKGNQNL